MIIHPMYLSRNVYWDIIIISIIDICICAFIFYGISAWRKINFNPTLIFQTLHITHKTVDFDIFFCENIKRTSEKKNFLKSSQWKFHAMNLHVRHQRSEAVEWKIYIVSFLLLLLFYANKPKGEKISFHSHFKAYFFKQRNGCLHLGSVC